MVRTRKPTKKRRVSSSHPQQQMGDFDLEFFDSFAHSEQWIVFKDRPIVWGRRVDLSAEYDHLLRYYIQRMDWEGSFDIPPVAYPQLIKLFYSNLRMVDDPTHGYYLMSYVKGVEMTLSVSALAQILRIPSGSEQIYFSEYLENEPEHRLKTPFTKTTITKMKLTHIETPTIPMEDAQVQGEDANAPGEQGDNSTHGSNFRSPSDIYTRLLHLEEQQCNLVQQFTAFRGETTNQFNF
ncbi:hypothetical protein RHGRI_007427 [Rhododendron griersonianum]|uniref:Uncharacterized protein n=1 Tax=Rhododendron griersonianum TaxID=479676 RepID=A0AAV6KYH0_9ERIC|nr:hypothetical protein RHGRI_007427 [Rhododendron griersonianum]